MPPTADEFGLITNARAASATCARVADDSSLRSESRGVDALSFHGEARLSACKLYGIRLLLLGIIWYHQHVAPPQRSPPRTAPALSSSPSIRRVLRAREVSGSSSSEDHSSA